MVKEEEENNETIIKMRGLPWSATVDDIISFLEANIKNGRAGVHITMSREGRPSGEAFVELETNEDLEKALTKDKQHMGHRYIEIFKTTRNDMDWYIDRSGSNVENVMDECCIRLRGLPYGCTKDDITKFFDGLTIVPNGISFVSDQTGRNTGEAYVQFVSKEMVEKALKKHLDKIGHRYIEIFRSSLAEIRAQTGPKIRPLMSEFVPRPSPYDRGDRFTARPSRVGGRGLVPPRMRDLVEDDLWDDGAAWSGNVRKPIGMREPIIPPLTSKGHLSPPPAVRARNAMYGNGKGPAMGGWEEEEQLYIVHMRGLPFRATEQDIMDFFHPLIPINVNIIYERGGRPSGEANVEFETYEDASQAMSKDKQNMHNRYIELFLRARPPVNKPPSLIGRNFSGRSMPGFQNDMGGPDTSLFSRRGASVSNSAYDGFYGTSTYRAAASGGLLLTIMPSADVKLDINNSMNAAQSSQIIGPNPNPEKRAYGGTSAESERKRRRKSRWGAEETDKMFIPGMPTVLPTNLSKEQEEAYVLQLQIEEVSRKLRTGDLGIPANPEERSPSPEPIYSFDGKRLNTREYRTRKRLEDERHQLIGRMIKINPEFKPPADYKPPLTRVSDKVMIPQDQHPDINFVGLLIGPRGNTLKAMEHETGAKIIIRGKGSVKEGKVGRKDGQPLPGENEPLHAYVTANNPEYVKKAVDKIKEIIRQGVEVPEGQNDLRRQQLRELALLNGTLRENDGIRCTNCGAIDHKSWACPDKPNVTMNVLCTICGGAGHLSKDCKQKKPGQTVPNPASLDKTKIDEEYMSLMAELGEAVPPNARSDTSGPGDKNRSSGHLFDRPSQPRALVAPSSHSLPTPLHMIPNNIPPPVWGASHGSSIPNVNVPPPPAPPAGGMLPPMQWPGMMPPGFQLPLPPLTQSTTSANSSLTSTSTPASTVPQPPPLMGPWSTPGAMMPPHPMWQPPAFPIKAPASSNSLPANLPSSVLMAPPPPPPPPPS